MEDSIEDFIRVHRNVKDTEPAVKISNELLLTIQRKKECEARALGIIEFLIDGKLKPEAFLHSLKYINQEQYLDIVEERAIIKLCGYCLCGRKLIEIPKQKYIISTRANKIYEITDRKNYCSNFCYKASLHIKDQIDTSPLWLQNFELANFNLLPASEIGIPGEEIEQGVAKPAMEPRFTSVSHFAEVCLSEADEKEIINKKSTRKKTNYKNRVTNPSMNTINENEEGEECNDEYHVRLSGDQLSRDCRNENANKMNVGHKENKPIKEEHCHTRSVKNYVPVQSRIKNMRIPKINNKIDVIVEETETSLDHSIVLNETSQITDSKCVPSNSATEKKKDYNSESEKLVKLRNKLQSNKTRQIKLIDAPILKQANESNLKISIAESEKKMNEEVNRKTGEFIKVIVVGNDEKLKTLQKTTNDETFRKVKQCINEWLTIETFLYIYGENKIKLILSEKKLLDCFDKLRIGELQTTQQLRYMNVCKRLQLQELAEEKFDSVLLGKMLKPLPDYKHLKNESKGLDLKVKSFYGGVMYEQPDSNFPTKTVKENQDVGQPAVLPLLDVSSQNALRRNVLLNSINRTIQNLIRELNLNVRTTLSDVRDLVKTFKLQAHNVVLKPSAWNLIAVILINMLAIKDEEIKKQLLSDRYVRHVDLVLCKFSGVDSFMKDLFCIIEDVDSFIEYHIISNNTV